MGSLLRLDLCLIASHPNLLSPEENLISPFTSSSLPLDVRLTMSLSGGLSTILPANENPYLALNGAYKSQLILKHPNSANPQLYFLSIVHAM